MPPRAALERPPLRTITDDDAPQLIAIAKLAHRLDEDVDPFVTDEPRNGADDDRVIAPSVQPAQILGGNSVDRADVDAVVHHTRPWPREAAPDEQLAAVLGIRAKE